MEHADHPHAPLRSPSLGPEHSLSPHEIEKFISLFRRVASHSMHGSFHEDVTTPGSGGGSYFGGAWTAAPEPTLDDDNVESNVEDFQMFEQRLKTLDQELLSFINAVRHLGSSIGLTRSAEEIRKRLENLREIFRGNLDRLHNGRADEFLESEFHEPGTRARAGTFPPTSQRRRPWRRKTAHVSHVESGIDYLPAILKDLADELKSFKNYIDEIADFSDEAVGSSLEKFASDLCYWSCNLDHDHKERLWEQE
ncbi:hypothetical protein DL93DRAFT_2162961, partial [Clavulina sp. PMI_390]